MNWKSIWSYERMSFGSRLMVQWFFFVCQPTLLLNGNLNSISKTSMVSHPSHQLLPFCIFIFLCMCVCWMFMLMLAYRSIVHYSVNSVQFEEEGKSFWNDWICCTFKEKVTIVAKVNCPTMSVVISMFHWMMSNKVVGNYRYH